jgi:hypothetical protein
MFRYASFSIQTERGNIPTPHYTRILPALVALLAEAPIRGRPNIANSLNVTRIRRMTPRLKKNVRLRGFFLSFCLFDLIMNGRNGCGTQAGEGGTGE